MRSAASGSRGVAVLVCRVAATSRSPTGTLRLRATSVPVAGGALAGARLRGAVLRCPGVRRRLRRRARRCRRRRRRRTSSRCRCWSATACCRWPSRGRSRRDWQRHPADTSIRRAAHASAPAAARRSRRANAARCVRSRSPTSTSTWSTSTGRQLMCICRGCYLLFTDTEAELRYRAVPDRYLSFPDFALDRRAVGGAADPGRAGVLLPQLRAGPHRGVLPGPGRRHRVRAGPGGVGRRSAPPTRGLDTAAPRRRGAAGPGARRRTGCCRSAYLVPIDACYEFVGRLRMLWRGFDGGQEARELHRRVLRRCSTARSRRGSSARRAHD